MRIMSRVAARAVRQALERSDPTPWLARMRLAHGPTPPVALLSVYRSGNARRLHDVLRPALAAGWDVRLWALDATAPSLSAWTRGVGPGGRFALVNKLAAGVETGSYLVVSDDDIEFVRGNIVNAVQVADLLQLDLSQPAHHHGGAGWEFTLARPLSIARRTTFVEIGPVVIVNPRTRPRICPFPELPPMGWGVDFSWTDLVAEGSRLGVIDAVRIAHTVNSGVYDRGREFEAVTEELRKRGATEGRELMKTLSTLRPWHAFGPSRGSGDAGEPGDGAFEAWP